MCFGTTHHHHHHQTQISLGPRPSRWRKNLDPRMHAIFTASISVSDPPPASQLLKYIMLKLHVQGIFIIILVYSIRFGYLWITCIYICQGFYPYRKELWSVTWCILFWFSEELSADRLYGFVAKEQGIFPGVSQDSVFPRKQRANLFYMYWKKQWD